LIHFYKRGIGNNIRAMATSAPIIKFLDMPNGRKIAYEKVEGCAGMPTVMFIPGFMSGKDGDKPRHLREYCIKKNYTFVRLRIFSLMLLNVDMILHALVTHSVTGHL